MDEKYILETFEDQNIFVNAALGGKYKTLCYAGSIRAGKTIVVIAIVILLAKAFPGSRWAFVRKDYPTIRLTTIPSFFKYAPSNFVSEKDYNKNEHIAKCKNGSEIIFISESIEKDRDLNKWKGLEVNGFVFDQIEEISQITFNKAIERRGQWRIDPMPPSLILASANPAQCWIKNYFYDRHLNGTLPSDIYFQQADIFKNPYIDVDYIESLKSLPPEIYRRFVLNSWDVSDDINQLVPSGAMYDCEALKIYPDGQPKIISLGVDVGRMGPDPTVFTILENGNIIKIDAFPQTKIYEVSDAIIKYMLDYNIDQSNICVDAVGIGAGVVDNLEKSGYNVIAMSGGNTAIVRDKVVGTHFKFANWKSWSYWLAAEAIKNNEIGGYVNDILISDTRAIKYYIHNDKDIKVMSKDELKLTLGRSCDYWDSFVYAVWAWKSSAIHAPVLYTYKMAERDKII